MESINRLNFGCGSIVAEGWTNVDHQDFGQDVIGSTDLFPPDYFDYIVAHCSLQMTDWHELPALLKDLHRILKPNGVLRISLPDIVEGFENYKSGNIGWFPNGEENIDVRFSGWLTWFSTTKTLLTKEAAVIKLIDAGFSEIHESDYKKSFFFDKGIIELDSRQFETYFLDAIK